MRIKEKFSEERKSEIINYKPKIIIVSEGSCSEPMYFEGLNQSVITENKTIINLLRDYANETNSHPNFIVDIYKEFFLNNRNKVTVREIKNKIYNYYKDVDDRVNVEKINSNISILYDDKDIIDFNGLEEFFLKILKEDMYKDFIINFIDYFNYQNITYSEKTDSVNIVIDRDRESFFDFQYNSVYEFCKENGVNMYVSNPNFEFWLMLHFDIVNKLDRDEMYNNKKVNSKRRYLERQLRLICGYDKSHLDFKKFEPLVENAVINEKNFCEDIKELKDNLGSNVGLLVEKIIHN